MSGSRPAAEMLEALQDESFRYFVHETNLRNGLVRDKTRDGWPASIAAVGMALTAYPVAVERALMDREEAARRTLAALRFFQSSPQGKEPDTSGHRGFYYHFLDMETGRRAWRCELSTVDTALLVAGALAAAAYFQKDAPDEIEVRALADAMYRRVDWCWALNRGATLTHGWKPGRGFLKCRWQGYDEALILYVLGLGSPTFPLPEESYRAWLSSYEWRTVEGYEYVHSGPLFTHQLAHIWIDFRGIQDTYMRERGIDYFENSRRATCAQRAYAIRNPLGFDRYGENCWGLTASDGPGPATRTIKGVKRDFYDYVARGVPGGPDDGTIAPWAVAASLPFAPEIVVPALEYYRHELDLCDSDAYGFKATFNPTFPDRSQSQYGWISPYHFGINEGPTILMIENHRTGLIWNLMRRSPYIVSGLRRAGFAGGWLDS